MVPSATPYDLRESQKLSGHSYIRGNFAIAQLSCLYTKQVYFPIEIKVKKWYR